MTILVRSAAREHDAATAQQRTRSRSQDLNGRGGEALAMARLIVTILGTAWRDTSRECDAFGPICYTDKSEQGWRKSGPCGGVCH